MKKLFWVIAAIGFILLLIGVSGMDSECLTVPVLMTVGGGLLFLIGERGFEYCGR